MKNSKFSIHSASIILVIAFYLLTSCTKNEYAVLSPDGNIKTVLSINNEGKISYTVFYHDTSVISASKLGIVRQDADFTNQLVLKSVSKVEQMHDEYKMLYGKRTQCNYTGNKQVFHFENKKSEKMDVIFQISNDGVAFRYKFPDTSTEIKKITNEITSFKLDTTAIAFLHFCPDSKTGWSETQPSYEEHYDQGNKVGKSAPFQAGWVFPALFNIKNHWVLITESDLDRNYCASRLNQYSPEGEYAINFPQKTEGVTELVFPESTLPWQTPWRIITIGNGLAPIMESTLGTDLSTPAKYSADAYYQSGKASWSWVILKDESVNFEVQKQFIDYAAEMNWQYCLVDGLWDVTIGYEKIKELADYAKTKNVGLILWYNSAGNWNSAYQTPKNRMLTHESRTEEFKRIHEIGIKGIKVDFFAGDGQSTIAYYQNILEDAAKYEILVNFHGATLPRGWQRTYPNLVTVEAVRGLEMVTFNQADANAQPNHCCMLPFTRNVFDPMDFTPMSLSDIPNIERKTTAGFELATSVIFLSGIQHYAEIPVNMAKQPEYVKYFLKTLPNNWDAVKYLDGYPGKFVILARKSGNKWYLAGINGTDSTQSHSLNLSFLENEKATFKLIKDGMDKNSFEFETIEVSKGNAFKITLKGNGGFCGVIE